MFYNEYYNLPIWEASKRFKFDIIESKELIIIYPNPGKDQISIRCDKIDGNGKMVIYNIQGKIVAALNVKEQVTIFDTSYWQQGIYILEYSTDNNKIHKKFSIIR